jgi:hypothetical protein
MIKLNDEFSTYNDGKQWILRQQSGVGITGEPTYKDPRYFQLLEDVLKRFVSLQTDSDVSGCMSAISRIETLKNELEVIADRMHGRGVPFTRAELMAKLGKMDGDKL